jgi:NAD(P)-dependent dehydrogenase (short-subunit alcohol dehydrogenase family)
MAVDRVALITGASRGVGAAVSRILATEGNTRIVVNYRNDRAAVERLLQELEKLRPQRDDQFERPFVTAIQADMACPADIARLVQETIRRMGRLDIVVSNVGWTRMTNFMNLDEADAEEDWDRCFEVNVKSHFRLFRACQAHLESSEGAFIATASVAGVKPSGSSLVSFLFQFVNIFANKLTGT